MNLLEMFKQLTEEEKIEFVKLLIETINKKNANESTLDLPEGVISGLLEF